MPDGCLPPSGLLGSNTSQAVPPAARAGKPRDLRIDVFRGLALFIIAIEHMGGNWLVQVLPMQFGFSSGADIFVLCSGLASALAFGAAFSRRGFWMGTLRIVQRVWQIYWAHLGCFLAALACTIWASNFFASDRFLTGMQHDFVISHPREILLGLVTLSYLPPLSDILPMYMVMLAMVPVVMLARRIAAPLPFVVVGVSYLLCWTVGIALPGNPVSGAHWLFNPFAWQIVFFTGFFVGMGWVSVPSLGNPWLVGASVAVLAMCAPVCWYLLRENVPALRAIWLAVWPENGRTDYHLLRYVHLLALAYLAVTLATAHPRWLTSAPAQLIALVGRQTLPVFLASVPLDILGGILLDAWGNTPLMVFGLTASVWAALVLVASVSSFMKSAPWASRPAQAPSPAQASSGPAGLMPPDRQPLWAPRGHAGAGLTGYPAGQPALARVSRIGASGLSTSGMTTSGLSTSGMGGLTPQG